MSWKTKSLSTLEQDIHQALKLWHQSEAAGSPLDYLSLFRQTGSDNARQATNELLLHVLDRLEVDFPEEARLLRLRFLDDMTMYAVANQLNISEPTGHRRQKRAIRQLAETVAKMEEEAREAHRARLESRLEGRTYFKLIGIEDHLDALIEVLTEAGPPWLISIEGMGGIGKTSLADALLRRIIREDLFDDLGWVTARQYDFNPGQGIKTANLPALTADNLVEKLFEQLVGDAPQPIFSIKEIQAALRSRLKQDQHLIVVDNLETLVDIETLLPLLRELSNPTKFLLTSRESYIHTHGLYHFPLPELSQANALRLIRYEAELHNSPYLPQAGDEQLKGIFQAVGGNPLAIRLVVGQTHVYPLETILNDLTAAQGQTIEYLYTFIYRRAWDKLDELTRRVFLAMPLVAEGEGDLVHISEISGIEAANLRDALERLVTLNLVDRKGEMAAPYYSIHNLTRTFLQEQVLRWS